VRTLLARVQADGVTTADRDDDPACKGFTCRDPDGRRIEVSGEPPRVL
jgi:hypothetical protein